MRRRPPAGVLAGALALLAGLVALVGLGAGTARGERTQYGNLIVSLDGRLSPLRLPRDHPAPISVRLDGGLHTADGALLPRVTEIELGLPGQAVISTRGLPVCPRQRLRDATSADALAACGGALVGSGSLEADVLVPNQPPFKIHARLLAFNGRVGGRRAVILHAFAARPPTVVVLPFVFRRGSGRFATALVADLPASLGPWPHFARFVIDALPPLSAGGAARAVTSAPPARSRNRSPPASSPSPAPPTCLPAGARSAPRSPGAAARATPLRRRLDW